MASAAAVAADQARSPISNNIGEDGGHEGEVTSAIVGKGEDVPDVNGNAEEDDEDEDLPSNPLRGAKRPRATLNADDEEEEEEGGAGDDLFGDQEDGVEEQEKPVRQLDDEELDSGDDMERLDRAPEDAEPEYIAQEKITMDLEYPRLPGPEPSDGEMYLLKVPSFMAIEPTAWHHTTFQPPTTEHHNFGKIPSDTFSASRTALSTIRWRHSPSNPEQLQSNARILRWSDGSLTLQLASDPSIQYAIDGNAIAPPQRNPLKPTPTSVKHDGGKGGRQGMSAHDEKFDSRKDGFTYLLRPYDENGTMLVTQKVTTGLKVNAPSEENDEAVAKLKAAYAHKNKSGAGATNGIKMMQVDEDPEKAKMDAIAAMRDIDKRNKKSLAAQEREAARANRALGRSGLGSSRYGGLNASMLEDDEDGAGSGRARPSPHKRPKPRRRANSEYSDDEDFGRKRGNNREDEYEEDDFLVNSDEEEEVVEDDDDPDDGIVEEERPGRRERTPKRGREDDEEDAPGEEEDDDDVPQARVAGGVKKRRVVEDEEEDE